MLFGCVMNVDNDNCFSFFGPFELFLSNCIMFIGTINLKKRHNYFLCIFKKKKMHQYNSVTGLPSQFTEPIRYQSFEVAGCFTMLNLYGLWRKVEDYMKQ